MSVIFSDWFLFKSVEWSVELSLISVSKRLDSVSKLVMSSLLNGEDDAFKLWIKVVGVGGVVVSSGGISL